MSGGCPAALVKRGAESGAAPAGGQGCPAVGPGAAHGLGEARELVPAGGRNPRRARHGRRGTRRVVSVVQLGALQLCRLRG